MKPRITMREALASDDLFGSVLPGDSWKPWRVLLIAALGEPLTDDEREIFRVLTKRQSEPLTPVEELWAVVGRRGGKTRSISVLSTYLAALCDWRDCLVPGERGRLFWMATNTKQASIAFNYARAIFQELPLFVSMVDEMTADTIKLTNKIDLEVRAASWRGIRGVTAIAAVFDELAFFQSDENSANADYEILEAIRPALATTQGPLIAISSPHAKRGQIWETVERDYKEDGDPLILVARGASRDFNPTLPQRVVDRAMERDAQSARAEYLGEFRDDIAAFVDIEIVQACTAAGVGMILPNKYVQPYLAFCDPSGGSSDSFTLAIGHDGLNDTNFLGQDIIYLDRLEEAKPPFVPSAIVAKFAKILNDYGLTHVYGDAYAANWVTDQFRQADITYIRAPLNKTQLFLNFLPLLNNRGVQLLDNPKMAQQFAGLERRVTSAGRETIDHRQNSHDDIANAAAGCIAMIARQRRRAVTYTTTTRAMY